jgi:ligand-binding sensor domain-containing protein
VITTPYPATYLCIIKQTQKTKAMNKITALLVTLFFFFLMSEAAQKVNVTNMIGANETVTAKAEIGYAIWVGTNNGLYIINTRNNKTTHLTAENSVLPSNHVTGIAVTTDGNVYVATEKGVFRYDGYAYLEITNENSNLPQNGITSIACDKNNNIWIGTCNKGLVMMNNNNKCRYFNTKNSAITANNVTEVKSDDKGNIFAQLSNNDVVKVGGKNLTVISAAKTTGKAIASAR